MAENQGKWWNPSDAATMIGTFLTGGSAGDKPAKATTSKPAPKEGEKGFVGPVAIKKEESKPAEAKPEPKKEEKKPESAPDVEKMPQDAQKFMSEQLNKFTTAIQQPVVPPAAAATTEKPTTTSQSAPSPAPETNVEPSLLSKIEKTLGNARDSAGSTLNALGNALQGGAKNVATMAGILTPQNMDALSKDTDATKAIDAKIAAMSDGEKAEFAKFKGTALAGLTGMGGDSASDATKLALGAVPPVPMNRLFHVLYENTKDLQGLDVFSSMGGSVIKNGMANIGSILGSAWQEVMKVWSDPNKNILEKMMGSVTTLATSVANGFKDIGTNGIKDAIVERANNVHRDVLALGCNDALATEMRKQVIVGAQTEMDKNPLLKGNISFAEDLQPPASPFQAPQVPVQPAAPEPNQLQAMMNWGGENLKKLTGGESQPIASAATPAPVPHNASQPTLLRK